MSTIHELLESLWVDYCRLNPQAKTIHRLLASHGDRVVNDHIALRTYDDTRTNVDVLAGAFVSCGYQSIDQYEFPEKKLRAWHFEHEDTDLPKVFISELKLSAFSPKLQQIVRTLLDQVEPQNLKRPDLPVIGRPWSISIADHSMLTDESEYAAWVAAFGFRANHFTVLVNALKNFDSLQQLNDFLKEHGFVLNSSGGEIKGSPEIYLEQSSTLADEAEVVFSDGTATIPCCYYEFARRHPLPSGQLFQGFVAKSADKIFESTDRR